MSILNPSRAIDRYLVDHLVYESSREYVDGENVETFPTSGSRKMAGFQLTADSLKYLPEGAYDIQDFRFYDKETAPLTERYVVERPNGSRYRIAQISDRSFEGGFNSYLAKKVKANDDPLE
jgi:hypothetical protein